jgi:phospholipid/cholesterol/gamma-HCH transport system substrate-binding protein
MHGYDHFLNNTFEKIIRDAQLKKQTSNKIKLGIFISLGMAVFIVGIYFIGERQQLFRKTFRVNGVFKDVGGLQEGNNVRLSGINVGTVENISVVSDSSVRVELLIVESTRKYIKKDAIASIGTEGLMGNKVLIINPGRGEKKEIEDNDTIKTVQPFNVDDILISLKTTVYNTSNITSDLSKITRNIQSGKGKLNLDDILISLQTTIDNTSKITSDLSKITGNIQSGKGTMGRLLMDPSLAQNLDSSIVNLKQSSGALKNLLDDVRSSVAQNLDSTFVNVKEGSAEFRILVERAKRSWLLWGF